MVNLILETKPSGHLNWYAQITQLKTSKIIGMPELGYSVDLIIQTYINLASIKNQGYIYI